jgi:hypothetical protein
MAKSNELLHDFYTNSEPIKEELLAQLLPMPKDQCECGSKTFLFIEVLVERVLRLIIKDGKMIALPSGAKDYHADNYAPIAACVTCDNAYDISQKLIGVEWD